MKDISIVVPVWNEEGNILPLLKRIQNTFKNTPYSFEILFVDDHSSDTTTSLIKRYSKTYSAKLLIKEGKKGKAYSLHEGIQNAEGAIIAILDADLQYPPEAIPQMAEKLHSSHADIIVANRKVEKENSKLRRFLSTSFRKVFGQYAFGLKADVQSGLKVFKKSVYQAVQYAPKSGWTFDLEFLHKSFQAGFIITDFDIAFTARKNGKSKVSSIATSWEIGFNALQTRLKPLTPLLIQPTEKGSMRGAGVGYKRQRYITHSTLSHTQSALTTITTPQRIVIFSLLLIVGISLIFTPLLAMQVIIGILSFVYFLDTAFNFFLVMKSLHSPQEITSTDEEIKKLDTRLLPVYSILCPLYREAHVIPQFLEAIEKLDYPKNKLDVLLLLEEDDADSVAKVERMYLPSYVRVVVVPHSMPKTKPKACNYGLSFAKGEYLVIYDAEDMPDPLQLKKAYLGFQKVGEKVLCLQAKLNYYNPHQNLLTRFFTAEYSLWFDVTLTGLQAAGTSIPLGGTSNHFRTKDLFSLEGWDPFNVTEDADLGIRLFKRGYKTAIIDSVTLEEANSNVFNWIRQRSRWIKGYMQTYLVHTRDNASFIKKSWYHALLFHLNIGGKIAFILINPFLWTATLSYFILYRFVGPTIESLYPSWIFYMALTSLVFGNFMFVYYYMIGTAKRDQWSLIKYIYLIPLYWLLISWSGFVALYQLIFKPHYWEKTIHGLHLSKLITQEAVVVDEQTVSSKIPAFLRRKISALKEKKNLYLGALVLIAMTMGGNVLNLLFNVYLGRKLSLEDFGELSLFTSLLYLTSVPLGSVSATIAHKVAYLYGEKTKAYAQGYLNYILSRSLAWGIGVSLLWVITTPLLSRFFQTEYIPMIAFAPLWAISFASSNFSGYLAGTLSFGKKGVVLVTEAILRLLIALLFVYTGHANIVFFAITISITTSVILSWELSKNKSVERISKEDKEFNFMFFITSSLSGISLITFLTLDVILVKHFLTPVAAGEYGILSLVGKMTYFLGSLFGPFMIPLVAHNMGAKKDSKNTFFFLMITTCLFSLGSFIFLGVFGSYFVPLIFGAKTIPIAFLLLPFVASMAIFTISQPIVSYFQAKQNYSFAIVGFFVALLQIVLTINFHKDLQQIVYVMLSTSIVNFVTIILLFVFRKKLGFIYSNAKDFVELFRKQPEIKGISSKNIIIFNWRDTKHKWAGGAEVYIHELAKRWVLEGCKVTIFSGSDGKSARREIKDGIEIIRRGGFYFVYIWAFLYYIFKFRNKCDVIVDSENGIPFFTPLYTRKKVYLLIHHIHQEVFRKSLKPPFSWLAQFLELKLMPLVYRNTQIITVSPSSKAEILRHKITKIDPIVIYNGVNLDSFIPGRKNKNPLILYLGRLQYYKSLNIFIKSASKILEKFPNAEFIIAGEGGEKHNLQRYTVKLGIDTHIQFIGRVSEEEKISLFQKAWVFVNPSFMEGWGITTIEANACGTPAIASNVHGLRDSVKHNATGILVPYGDTTAFAQNIIDVIENAKLRNMLSKNAIAWAKEFDWEVSAKRFYEELIQDDQEFITKAHFAIARGKNK